jgi:hypothetical protein
MGKKFLFISLAILVAIQFIRPARNKHTDSAAFRNDITTLYKVPDDVMSILKTSCYDCHSNYTNYPWYSNIQPIGWWLQFHVDDGKLYLNFSEFAAYSPDKQKKKLKEVIEEIESDKMPLPSYIWGHKDAKLTEDEKHLITNWVSTLRAIE